MEDHVAGMLEMRNVYEILFGNPERKRTLVSPKCRWEENIEMDLQENKNEDMDWIDLPEKIYRWRTLVNAVLSFRVP